MAQGSAKAIGPRGAAANSRTRDAAREAEQAQQAEILALLGTLPEHFRLMAQARDGRSDECRT